MAGIGRILISGGASGLGAATVRAVQKAGGTPLVLDRQRPAEPVDYDLVDVADAPAVAAAVTEMAENAGGIDGVVTCAGIDSPGALDEVPVVDWQRVIGVNLVGTAAVVRAALHYVRQSQGRVVTVSSTLGLRSVPNATAYCASKAGVIAFTRALAAETAGEIGVTAMVPGGMDTAFFDGRDEQYKPPPDAKLNDPEDAAETIMFALRQPPGCEVRELVVAASEEGSWP